MKSRADAKPATASAEGGAASGWPLAAAAAIGLGVLALLAYRDTAAGLYEFWATTESYSHSYLLIPMALYFLWERRGRAARHVPGIWAPGVVGLAVLAAAWLAGRLVDIRIVQELALLGILAGVAITVLGWRVAREFWFSWVCILLAVPIWSELIPILQDWTAQASAASLQLIGVPVFLEGYYLAIPNGQFVVAEVCAGLRFLLATMSVGALYAYLNFDEFRRGLLVFVIAVVSSIIFNWVRVDLIILSGHLFGMDHYFVKHHIGLGWVVFVIALVPMFVAGRLLAGDDEPGAVAPSPPAVGEPPAPARLGVVSLLAAVALVAGPVTAARVESGRALDGLEVVLAAPPGANGWSGPFEVEAGRGPAPSFAGAHGEVYAGYRRDGVDAQVYVAHYVRQSQDHEIVNNRSTLATSERWTIKGRSRREAALAGSDPRPILEVVLESPFGDRHLMWRWFEVGGEVVAGRYGAKLAQLIGAIGGDESATVYAVMVPLGDERTAARRVLAGFVDDMLPALVEARRAARPGPRSQWVTDSN